MRSKKIMFCLVLGLASLNVIAQQLVPFLKGKEWKVYDKAQKKFLSQKYDAVLPSKGGLLFVQQGTKWGALNSESKLVIPVKYISISQLNRSVISARDEKGILLIDTLGKIISQEHYSEVGPFKWDEKLIVALNAKSKFGIINSAGKIILDFIYDFAPEHLGDGFLKVSIKQPNGSAKSGLLDTNFQKVLDVKFHSIEIMYDHNIRCSEDGENYVLYNPDMKKLYSGPHQPTRVCRDYIYLNDDDHYGFVNRHSGKIYFCPQDMNLRIFEETGIAIFYSQELSQQYFFHPDGDSASLKGYVLQYLEPSVNSLVIRTGPKSKYMYGIADFKGNILVPCTFSNISIWNNRYFSVSSTIKDEKGKFVARYELYEVATGKRATPIQYEAIDLFNLGGVALRQNGSWRLYNSNLQPWDKFEYSSVSRGQRLNSYSQSFQLFVVERIAENGIRYKGCIDGECRPVIPCTYNEVRAVESNYRDYPGPMRISASWNEPIVNSVYGKRHGVFLDRYGRNIAIPECAFIGYEMNGMFTITREEKYEDETRGLTGLIDSMGKLIIPMEYDEIRQVGPLQGFYCTRNGVTLYADKSGNVYPASGFSYSYPISENYFIGIKNRRKGIINRAGVAITQFNFDEVRNEVFLNGTLFRVKKNSVEFYVDNNGNEFYSEQ